MNIDYSAYSNNETNEEKHINELNYYGQIPEIEETIEIETESKESEDIIQVSNCEKCYIREKPSKNSDHVAIVSNGVDLLIVGNSTFEEDELWHNVCTESGAEGYIMAKFTNSKD